MSYREKCIALSGWEESTFEEFEKELFGKYLVSGEIALYALAMALRQCNRLWDVESTFVELLPLFTERNPFETIDEIED